MKFNLSREWCLTMAEREGDAEVGAGLLAADPSIRVINCEVCQTEGRILTSNGGPDEIDNGPCPACKGERVVEVETEH